MVEVSFDVTKVFEWIDKVRRFFKPFKPEIRSLVINYKDHTSTMNMALHIPDSIRRRFNDIEVPIYPDFSIGELLDETFHRVKARWRVDDGKWKMRASDLPASENFLITLIGKVPSDILSRIVRIQPASNRDQTEELDSYWLDCMIKDVTILEKIWDDLCVEDVSVGVNVGIDRCFSTTIPKELKDQATATQRWLRAGRGSDRAEIWRSWRNLRRAEVRMSKSLINSLMSTIYKLTTGEMFTGFVKVDLPYSIGEIRRDEGGIEIFPSRMIVEATTELNFKNPAAHGYLRFKKKDYIETIRKLIAELFK